jgi:hypothetical protein
MSIYEQMRRDWQTYCLMAGIAIVEEFSKPYCYSYVRKFKSGKYEYKINDFKSLRLKVKDLELLKLWFEITKHWENKLKMDFLWPAYKLGPKKTDFSQYQLYFSPNWLFQIMKTVGNFPSRTTSKVCLARLISSTKKRQGSKYIFPFMEVKRIGKKNRFEFLFEDKILAAGAFIVSFDFEFRGIGQGIPALCMSTTYEDFLNFMLKLAQKWDWTKNKKLVKVKQTFAKRLGINATPQKEFRLSIEGFKKIYMIGGPLGTTRKDDLVKLHVARSNRKNKMAQLRPDGETKKIIFDAVRKGSANTSTELQKFARVRVDVILDHLHKLEKEGLVSRVRKGKRYLWSYNAN